MAGAWPSLNNHPVRPTPSTAPRTASPRRPSPSCRSNTPVHYGPGTAAGVRRTKGMRRGSPTQRQGRNHLSQLSPYRRGGRAPARLAQDRVTLGQGRQATLPEDPGRPPPLPRSRDPRAGQRTSRGSDRLTVQSVRGRRTAPLSATLATGNGRSTMVGALLLGFV